MRALNTLLGNGMATHLPTWARESDGVLRLGAKRLSAASAMANQDTAATRNVIPAAAPPQRYGEFVVVHALSGTQVEIMDRVGAFFDRETIASVIIPLVDGKATGSGSDTTTRVSLRTLDWFVTNYAKSQTLHITPLGADKATFAVHPMYKQTSSHYRRRNFDPFRRRHKVEFAHGGKVHATTVAQLNFIEWAHRHGVLRYCRAHLGEIERHNSAAMGAKRRVDRLTHSQGMPRKLKTIALTPNDHCVSIRGESRVAIGI